MRELAMKLAVTAAVGVLLWVGALPPVRSAQASQQEEAPAGPTGTETLPDEGRWHLEPGETWEYRSTPPTSGPHDPKWIKSGFYRTVQPPAKLVHSLEHGVVVIYYDRPAPDVLATLRGWTAKYPGKWDGVIVAPLPGLGRKVVLTAWRKRLRLDPFDADRAQAFIDAFRGHGPESEEGME